MTLHRLAVTCIAVLAVFQGCAGSPVSQSLSVLEYNVQNLFDAELEGHEYAEFQPSEAGWNQKKFSARIKRIADFFASLQSLPDVVVLEEVESQAVVDAILKKTKGNPWSFGQALYEDGEPKGSIHLAVLSRWTPDLVRAHRITEDGAGSRAVWELGFGVKPTQASEPPSPFVLFANHWKSKVDGEEETESLRVLSASILHRLAQEWHAIDPALSLIAAGDFNEDARDEPSITVQALVTPEGGTGVLVLADRESSSSAQASDDPGRTWFEPWNENGGAVEGSYVIKSRWERIDHILCSPNTLNGGSLKFRSFAVISEGTAKDKQGYPQRYDVKRGSGMSDHFPLLATFTWAGATAPSSPGP